MINLVLLCALTVVLILPTAIRRRHRRKTRVSASCRTGDRRDERGVHGLQLVMPADGNPAFAVVRRERVRKTQPRSNQWFCYFALTQPVAAAMDGLQTVYALVEYQLPSRYVPEAPDLRPAFIVIDYDSMHEAGRVVAVQATIGDTWQTVALTLPSPVFSGSETAGFSLSGTGSHLRVSAEAQDGRKLPLLVRWVCIVRGQ